MGPGTLRLLTRVLTRLDIVHIKRSIGIRSKIHKPVTEVLQPIMARYLPDTPMDQVCVIGTVFVALSGQLIILILLGNRTAGGNEITG